MKSREEVLSEIFEIFISELNLEKRELSESSTPNSIYQWTSVSNLILVSAMEERFGISFSLDFIFKAESIGDYCNYIFEELKKNPK